MKALYLLLPLIVLAGTGCGKKKDAAKKPAAAAAAAEVNWNSLMRTMTVSAVIIRPEVGEPCDLNKAKRIFPYDSATIGGDAQARLGDLATCLKTGALAGKQIKIIGHDAARGEAADDAYRAQTGQTRAEAVAKVLENAGLGANRMTVVSLGERFVSEEGPEAWPVDRRVDIVLDNGEE